MLLDATKKKNTPLHNRQDPTKSVIENDDDVLYMAYGACRLNYKE